MSGKLFILSGASGCGKTTLLNLMCFDQRYKDPNICMAPKYSERPPRQDSVFDDVTHVAKDIFRENINDYDIRYFINKHLYGVKTKEILNLLDKGINLLIVLSDFRVLKRIKNIFGERVVRIYISSSIDAELLRRIQLEREGFMPDDVQKEILSRHFARVSAAARLRWWDRVSKRLTNLIKDWNAYATDQSSTKIRIERIRAFHTRYIEHISLFDHVILNYSEDKPEEMAEQLKNIISEHNNLKVTPKINFPPIFVVAAASASGKGSLTETLRYVMSDEISITSKQAKRDPKPGDHLDGMKAIGKDGKFSNDYTMTWRFHQSEAFEGVEYAVNPKEIQNYVINNKPQLFTSNIKQFNRFREIWPENVVFIYLHRLGPEHDIREYQNKRHGKLEAEARMSEIYEVHNKYINHISEFNHVLLNTGSQEDLYDQMFQLVEYYKNLQNS